MTHKEFLEKRLKELEALKEAELAGKVNGDYSQNYVNDLELSIEACHRQLASGYKPPVYVMVNGHG